MSMQIYKILQSIARQHGVNPDQNYRSLKRDLFRLAELKRWNWRPPKD